MSEEVGIEKVLEMNEETVVHVAMEGVTTTTMTMTTEAELVT